MTRPFSFADSGRWQRRSARVLLPVLLVAILGGCSLPRGAPVQGKILREAETAEADFSVVAVTRETVAGIAAWPRPQGGPAHDWPRAGRGPASSVIAAGDLIDLTVWESGDNPLLAPESAKSVQIANVAVSPAGTVFVPYVGEVLLRGLTPDRARETLQTQFDGVLDSPQVLLTVNQGRQNTVDLVGGVARAGSYPLPDRNFSVLSLLSQGGGIPPGLRNPQLRLVRGSTIYGISARRLMEDPRFDTVLRGGDKVIVEEDSRYFLSLGAASQQNQIHFPQDDVSALDAMALLGGVAAARANPEGILIMRDYPDRALRADGSGPDRRRMVFTLDLTTADGLFSARKFRIEPGDLVLVTESPINSLRTVLGLIGQGVGLANAASAVNGN